jgi:tetratricopeptide (TPR) repeat protein
MSVSAPPELTTLAIRHLPGSDPASFQVARLRDGKTSQPVPVLSPIGFPVEGRPNSDLMRELQWYLETFLDYPFPPETEHAERVLKALRDWGEQAFRKLFDEKTAGRMFDAATANDYSRLHLQISSDDPRVLAWPWEALRDPELGFLAHTCQVERRLNTVRDAQELPESLPKDRVNILLVVARPYGKKDVSFRSIARPLVELIEKEKLPAFVELLRPPTFDRLLSHLRERPGFYHILHFDGHGAYSTDLPGGGGYTLQGPEGKLVFETVDGGPDPIAAEKLSALLKECAVPGVVLNACQSAMVGSDSSDPFSSVAMALLRSGMRDVVAMAYSLYVSGAQHFLPAFYRRLFEAGSMAVAVRAGRQQMWQHDQRTCVRGKFPLQDWLLPVLYQQDPLNFSFATELREKAVPRASRLPEDLRREKNPYAFIGRDSALLEMERAMRRAPAGILIQGLGGVGKTTLARGFLQWLDQTGGLEYPPFWFSFQEIRSAEYVFNRMGEALFGGDFPTLAMEKKIEALAAALREHRLLIVWDNFESAAGIAGTAVNANLSDADRELLAQFLGELRGGATKVIITSRSPEDWLGPQRRFLLPLGGLDREERWEYCNAILHDLGSRINRNDQDLVELMDLLGGHPLAMRALLPRLEKLSAAQVLAALRSNLASLKLEGDEDQAKLYATLAFVEQSLPEELRPLQVLLGLHEGFVTAALFEMMAKQVDAGWSRAKINALMQALVTAGLLRDFGQAIHEMHPLLTSYLRSAQVKNASVDHPDGWSRAFVDVMARLADDLAPRQLHEQRVPFHLHGQNFHYALAEAERIGMSTDMAALTQSLAAFAQNNRNFAVAQRLFERLAAYEGSAGHPKVEASAYHQLGMIAEEQLDFGAAEQWYRKSLAIKEKEGDEHGASITYHQLGMIAQKQRDFAAAEQWYRKSLAIEEEQGNERGASITYHQLGMIAQKQGDFPAAEKWYGKSLAIKEKQGNEQGAAITYGQLGNLTEEQRDFVSAEQWYRKSLAITEKHGIEHITTITYHQLGVIAQARSDFAAAEEWYRKSLAIEEKHGNEHGAAITYGQLGIIAGLQGNFLDSGQWLIKSMLVFLRKQDPHEAARNTKNFTIIYKHAPPHEQEKLKSIWREAGLGELPNDSES